MGRTLQYQCIVLRTHDVGEADRFCVLLTKERGKIAARAYGVRKPKSRMGGCLLALQEAAVMLREGSSGMTVHSTICSGDREITQSLPSFLQAEQAIELLLSVLEDDHPVPEIYELTREFLYGCRRSEDVSALTFTIKLMQLLGVLPKEETHRMFEHFSQEEREFIEACSQKEWWNASPPMHRKNVRSLCDRIVGEQTNRELKVAPIARSVLLRQRTNG